MLSKFGRYVLVVDSRGFSVRIFLPDGDPDGVKANWTGDRAGLPALALR
ncbi:MAG: hypothetical protein IH957_05405 [Chloroflexi bacterium]|nr:hypothetical protein [Chloroflexota bacterium]